jgi:hypothetical protein
MSEEKAATGGDINYMLIYGGKTNGTRAPEDAIDADGNTDQTKVTWNFYCWDEGKWEFLEMGTPEFAGMQEYMNNRNQKMAFIAVPHQAITINEDDEVVDITLPT